MKYEHSLINFSSELAASDRMYSLILLSAKALSITLCGIKCWLDGKYLLCLSKDDNLSIHSGSFEAKNLRFLPYFYNVNLNHDIIGNPVYEDMRAKYGYPDFHLFRERSGSFNGIIPLSGDEYELANRCFLRAETNINNYEIDGMWSCHARSDMISILRIAESAYLGESVGEESEVIRYIRDHLSENITLETLCKKFDTNRTTLAKRIKELTGMSPMKYVLEERLNQSRPDLLFTFIPISELAEKYGFADTSYYIRAFKKRFGKSPLRYRKDGFEKRVREQEQYRYIPKDVRTSLAKALNNEIYTPDEEFSALLDEAASVCPLPADSQLILLLSSKGKIYKQIVREATDIKNHNDLSVLSDMRANEDTEIKKIVCLWKGENVDVPSVTLRRDIVLLNRKNINTEILLSGTDGFSKKTLQALFPV